ncbi:MAG: hypothetical protein ACXVA9_10635, partial [Bdellovibrionales bacterium]
MTILTWAFIVFGLQTNLTSIFAYFFRPSSLVFLTPGYLVGYAIGPAILILSDRLRIRTYLAIIYFSVLVMATVIFLVHQSQIFIYFSLISIFALGYANLLNSVLDSDLRKNYVFDLLGGMIGFLFAVLLLPSLGAENIFAGLLVICSLQVFFSSRSKVTKTAALVSFLALAAIFIYGLTSNGLDLLRVSRSGFNPEDRRFAHVVIQEKSSRFIASRWSVFSRVDAIELSLKDKDQKRICLFYNDQFFTCLPPAEIPPNTLQNFYSSARTSLVIGVGGGND